MPYPLYAQSGAGGEYNRLKEFQVAIPELLGVQGYGVSGNVLVDHGDDTFYFSEPSEITIDHSTLAGLTGDGHTQYLLANGSRVADLLTITGALTVDTDTLVVDEVNHRVGIGTQIPTSDLHILDSYADITVESSSATSAGVVASKASSGFSLSSIAYGASAAGTVFGVTKESLLLIQGYTSSSAHLAIGTITGADVLLGTNDTLALTIDGTTQDVTVEQNLTVASGDFTAAIVDGVTGSRTSSPAVGQMYFDTTLGYAIWYDGSNWVDATGTTV